MCAMRVRHALLAPWHETLNGAAPLFGGCHGAATHLEPLHPQASLVRLNQGLAVHVLLACRRYNGRAGRTRWSLCKAGITVSRVVHVHPHAIKQGGVQKCDAIRGAVLVAAGRRTCGTYDDPAHRRLPRSAMQLSRSFLVSGQVQQIFFGLPSGGPMGAADCTGAAGTTGPGAAGAFDSEAPMSGARPPARREG